MPKEVAEPLYVSRAVKNGQDIVDWARSQGLPSMLYPDDLHVTVCYSKEPFVWSDVPDDEFKTVRVAPIDEFPEDDQPVRKMEMFGKDNNVLVIQLESDELYSRWQEFCDHGASYDFPEYKPHITITYKGGGLAEASSTIEPYRGEIILGPEKFKKINKAWAGDAPEIDLTKDEEALPFEMAEGVEYSDGKFVVLRDPTVDQVRSLMSRCDEGLRAILADDLYVWDAAHMSHSAAKRMLGLTYGDNLNLSESAAEIEVSMIGFTPDELDNDGWSDHDMRWFRQAHREVRECWSRLENDTVMRRLYGEVVPVTVNDTAQWSGLNEFLTQINESEDYGFYVPPHPDKLGRQPAKPRTFFGFIVDRLQHRSQKGGTPVRIDAEDAIDKGVPREYIFQSSGAIRAPANKVFSSRFGGMRSKECKFITMDWDNLDPEQWGFQAEHRIDPEEIGDLFRMSFEGDEEAFDRYDPRYERWMTWQHEMDSSMEFYDRFGDEDGNLLPRAEVERMMHDHPPIGLPDDEIVDHGRDVPPPESDEYGAGPERFRDIPPRLHEMRSELAGNVRVTVDPSADQLIQMCESAELNGITDGKHVYVWPAAGASHLDAMSHLSISLEHYGTRFSAVIPQFGVSTEELQERLFEALIMLPCGVVIAASPSCVQDIRRAPVAESWFSGRPALIETREHREPVASRPLFEATNDPLPKKFWLVFDVPSSKHYNDEELARFESKLKQISTGHLKGIRGISDTREIVTDWFLMCRNAVAVMDPAAVAAENDISKVQYSDPDHLCANNFEALYRIWDKEGSHGKPNHNGFFHNLMEYVCAALKKTNDFLSHLLSNNGARWKTAKLWEADPTGVNTAADAGRKIMEFLKHLCATEGYGFSRVAEELEGVDMTEAVRAALLYVGRLYSSEGEWIVSSEGFTIPHNTILMIGVDPDVAADYPAYLDNPEGELRFKINNYRYENYHRLMKAINDYGLRDRYALRFVDSRKFENLRSDVMVKRRNRKEKLGENAEQKHLPQPGETPFWVADLAPISKDLVHDDWTWTEGGCWAFAYALKAAIGGTLAGICEFQEGGWGTHHALILKNGRYYDYNGVVDPEQACAAMSKQVGGPCKIMTSRNDYFEAYQDEFLDDDQYKFLFKVLRQLRPRKPR